MKLPFGILIPLCLRLPAPPQVPRKTAPRWLSLFSKALNETAAHFRPCGRKAVSVSSSPSQSLPGSSDSSCLFPESLSFTSPSFILQLVLWSPGQPLSGQQYIWLWTQVGTPEAWLSRGSLSCECVLVQGWELFAIESWKYS